MTSVTLLKKKMRHHFAGLLLFMSSALFPQDYAFVNYSTDDGLPTSQIYQVVMDSRGYIWFTSDAGIGRFEMGKVHVVSKRDGLPDNTVFTLLKTDDNRMLGTCYNNYLFELNTQTGKITKTYEGFFRQFEIEHSYILQTNVINDTIYTTTNYGLFYCGKNDKAAKKIVIKNNSHLEILVRGGRGLLNTNDTQRNSNIIGPYTPDSLKITVDFGDAKRTFSQSLRNKKVLYNNFRTYYLKDRSAVVLLLANNLFLLNKNGSVVTCDLPSEATYFFVDRDGDYWFGSRSDGVYVFKGGDLQKKPEHLLGKNGVSSICNDLEGGTWISTLQNGIFYCPSKVFKQINEAKLNHNILKLDHSKDLLYAINSNDEVLKLSKDTFGELNLLATKRFDKMELNYIKCYHDNVYINGRNGCFYTNRDLEPNSNDTRSGFAARNVLIDRSDSIWVLYYIGLVNLTKDFRNDFMTRVQNINGFGLALNGNNELVIGTIKGLFKYDRRTVMPVLPNNLILRNRIDHVFIDSKERYWLTINGIGLGILQNGHLYLIPLNENGIKAKVNCIVEDKGVFWVGTKNGLYQVTLTEGEGKVLSHSFSFFSKEDGLVSNEINDLKLFKNNLIIATVKGLCYARVDQISKTYPKTPIYLRLRDDPAITNKNGIFSVDHTLKKVVIEISQPSYRTFKKPRYYYSFSNDGDSVVQSSASMVLENLQYGPYNIKIKNLSEAYPGSRQGEISFIIQKPFWLTTWFMGIVISVVILFIFLFIKLRIARIRRIDIEKLKTQKLLNEYKMNSLQAQMNPHFMFNAFNSIQQFILTKQPDEAYDYLAKFSKLIRLVLEMSRNSYTSLAKEIELLHLYMSVERIRVENKFDYSIDVDPNINISTASLPIMIIQPHVENAIWHGFSHLKNKRGNIVIHIYEENGNLVISIKDNGVGRQEAKKYSDANNRNYSSLSTNINQERLNLFESTIEIIDLKNEHGASEGTEILIKLNNSDE